MVRGTVGCDTLLHYTEIAEPGKGPTYNLLEPGIAASHWGGAVNGLLGPVLGDVIGLVLPAR